MFPDLVTVAVEEPLDQWVTGVEVEFIRTYDVSADGLHMTEVVKDIKSVVPQTESLNILEVEAKYIVRFEFNHFGSPVDISFLIGGIEGERISGLRGIGGMGSCLLYTSDAADE